jgi:hypothetical protein
MNKRILNAELKIKREHIKLQKTIKDVQIVYERK